MVSKGKFEHPLTRILQKFSNKEVDQDQLNDSSPPIPAHCLHDSSCDNCWRKYPQSRFPNWTYRQVVKSKIQKAITEYNTDEPCILYRVDVDSKGFFSDVPAIVAEHGKEEKTWHIVMNQPVCSVISVVSNLFQFMSEASKSSRERSVHRELIRPYFTDAWNKVSTLHCSIDPLSYIR